MQSRTGGDGVADAVRTLLDRREFVEALREGPKDKRTLVEETDVSRSTVSRAVRELEATRLVERTNGTYRTTAFGDVLAEEFASLLATASFAWDLRDVLDRLPADELGFELSRLADADVTTPTTANPTAPIERVVELKRDATRVRSLAAGRSPGALDAHRQAADAGDHSFESVCSAALVEWLVSDAERRETLAGLLGEPNVAVYVYDGDIEIPVGITDDAAFFGVESEEGAPVALVESTDDRVREWAVETFEAHRRAADELAPGDLDDYADGETG
jgi:predicted transcriptional regulator